MILHLLYLLCAKYTGRLILKNIQLIDSFVIADFKQKTHTVINKLTIYLYARIHNPRYNK